ncbi:MAG: GerMN domain-containing protein [Candidatus Latescibacteria bacterium]|nr:GerMN domain-containing protein [Candidatus Latescibacterota bacterium]
MKRRWALTVLGAALIVAAFFWLARGRNRASVQPSRLLPLASELEGIRGVYLYFGVPGADSVAAEYRDVVVKDRPADQVRAIYRELLAGPSKGRLSLFPEGTELLETYWTERGTLYLDWNKTLTQGFRGGSARERALIASIVRTAGENLPGVERVMILVDGEPAETIGGHFDVLSPLLVRDWQ